VVTGYPKPNLRAVGSSVLGMSSSFSSHCCQICGSCNGRGSSCKDGGDDGGEDGFDPSSLVVNSMDGKEEFIGEVMVNLNEHE